MNAGASDVLHAKTLQKAFNPNESWGVQNLSRPIPTQPAHYTLDCAGKVHDDFVSKDYAYEEAERVYDVWPNCWGECNKGLCISTFW